MTNTYTVVLIPDPDAGGYVAYVPAIPHCVTEGDTVEEAIAMAQDAAAAMIASMSDHDEAIPIEPVGRTIVAAISVPVSALAESAA